MTYNWHPWPLTSDQSWLKSHTYCDSGQPFMMIISEDQLHSHLLPSFDRGAVTNFFKDLDLSQSGIETQSPACEEKALPLRIRGVWQESNLRVLYMVTYFCYHLSDNYLNLSDHYVDFSEKNHNTCNSVLVAYHTNCQISMLTCQIFLSYCPIFMLTAIYLISDLST